VIATIRTDDLSAEEIFEGIRNHAPSSIDHIVEVAFQANIEVDPGFHLFRRQTGACASRVWIGE